MKIVVLDGRGVNPGDVSWEVLKQFGDLTIYEDKQDVPETIRRIGDSEIVLTCKSIINEEVLEKCPNIRFISLLSTGYDVVDIEAAARRGIPVSNVPVYASDAVAQFTFALILELCHRVGLHDRSVHEGDWGRCEDFCYLLSPQTELSGKTLGIIGYGNIGSRVGKIAQAMGMKVIFNSPHHEGSTPLEELLRCADIVSLNCRLTEESRNLINEDTIAIMKDGAWIINTARGPLIDENALTKALNSGKLGAAAMDVVSREPIMPDNPLYSARNCIITPHIAWYPKECRQRLIDVVAENVKGFLQGKPQNRVN